MKILGKLLFNVLLGIVALILVNLVGKLVNFHMALNAVTAVVVGLLGLPGFLLLVIFRIIFM